MIDNTRTHLFFTKELSDMCHYVGTFYNEKRLLYLSNFPNDSAKMVTLQFGEFFQPVLNPDLIKFMIPTNFYENVSHFIDHFSSMHFHEISINLFRHNPVIGEANQKVAEVEEKQRLLIDSLQMKPYPSP